jgi:hypothetical protein
MWTVDLEKVVTAEMKFDQAKAAKRAALAARRYAAEAGGIVLNGAPIRTDPTSQSKITGAVSLFNNDPKLTSIDWEGEPGTWVSIDKATMIAIGIAVGRHVQACFSNARSLSEQIDKATDKSALDAIDIETGWPA